MNHPPACTMFVYTLTEPVDDFDALTPLPDWITADPVTRTRWALQAVLALADAADQIRWDGDMRHLPSVGAVLAPARVHPLPGRQTGQQRHHLRDQRHRVALARRHHRRQDADTASFGRRLDPPQQPGHPTRARSPEAFPLAGATTDPPF